MLLVMSKASDGNEPGVFETDRLRIRPARPDDAALVHALWIDPRVMTFVGFPQGLPTTPDQIRLQIDRDAERPLVRLLIVEQTHDGRPIGQCRLGKPDEEGIAEPDIKLLPESWGRRYGREAWSAMIDHLFGETDCRIVQGTPNLENVRSIRMMESCGMRRVGEGVFRPPEGMKDIMIPVPHVVYRITRGEWCEGRTLRDG